MTRLRLLARPETPPGKFRYRFPQDGHTVSGFAKESWLAEIKAHYQRNGYEMPADWREIAEDQLAQTLPAGWAKYDTGEAPTSHVEQRFTLDDFIHGTIALGSWKLSGDPVVDHALAESRALTCSRCYMNIGVPGCAPCHEAAQYITDAGGGQPTKSDAALRACSICHCSLAAAVHIPIEHLAKGVSAVQREQFRKVPWCWRAAEMDAVGI